MGGKSEIDIFAKIYLAIAIGLVFLLLTNKKPHLCCPYCSFEYQESVMSTYCPNCGKKINNVCSNCSRSFENDQKIPAYCPDCGTKQLDSKEK